MEENGALPSAYALVILSFLSFPRFVKKLHRLLTCEIRRIKSTNAFLMMGTSLVMSPA
jgi:hypothetical protein